MLGPFGRQVTLEAEFSGVPEGGATTFQQILDCGLLLGSPWAPFFIKNNIFLDPQMHQFFDVFFKAFGIHFGRRLGSMLHPKTCLERKNVFFFQTGFQAVNQHVPPLQNPAVWKSILPREWRIAIPAYLMRVDQGN